MALNIKPFYPFDHPCSLWELNTIDSEISVAEKSTSANVSSKNLGSENHLSNIQDENIISSSTAKKRKKIKMDNQLSEKLLRSLDFI